MVGIVLVAHSADLARGLKEIAQQMSQNQANIATAGGIDDHKIGTNAERIKEAIESVYSTDGVLIFFDLGSALMSTEVAIEMLPPDKRPKIKISGAPMVEGAVIAAIEASLGHTLEQVNSAAEAAREMPKIS